MNLLEAFEQKYPLQFTAPLEILNTLKELQRTGWVQWGIEEPETVCEHIRCVRKLAYEYKDDLELSEGELQDLLNILEVHDWPEVMVGDGVILGDEENVDKLRAYKNAREYEAMQTICDSIEDGTHILSLYERYTKGDDRIAQLAKQIEKLQAVFVAAEYEKKYRKEGLTKEFIHYTKDVIHEPFLIKELERMVVLFPVLLLSNFF